ncbi:uncharacterized protein [Euphorbia lathyris]|uniref:uncharacterized protein isoform X1 n=1 Tax=Euphorbia lathyris TaxID=212925 RepID=UPI003313565D
MVPNHFPSTHDLLQFNGYSNQRFPASIPNCFNSLQFCVCFNWAWTSLNMLSTCIIYRDLKLENISTSKVPEDILVKGVVGCRQVKIFFFTNSVFAEFGLADQNKKLGDIAASHLLNLWSGKASSGGASWKLS